MAHDTCGRVDLPLQPYPSQRRSGLHIRKSDPSLRKREEVSHRLMRGRGTTLRVDVPKFAGPLAGTILPGVRPWNKIGSSPGPAANANVQTAEANLSS